jgi:hypothetical protein
VQEDPDGFPDGYQVQPNVGLDAPGFNGELDNWGELTTSNPNPAEQERLNNLQVILEEGMMSYYQGENGVEPVATSQPTG